MNRLRELAAAAAAVNDTAADTNAAANDTDAR